MARKRRIRRVDARPARAAMPANPGWRWRTLPVWLALTGGFIAGWYIAALGVGQNPEGIAYFILLAMLVGFSLGLSRIMRWLTERWIARRHARALAAQTGPDGKVRPAKKPQSPS